MRNNKRFGNWGEAFARKYFGQKGYEYICGNYRVRRLEIDLIFRQKNLYVFVEVKTRAKNDSNTHDNFLSSKQLNNLKLAALNYCQKNKISPEATRHDLIVILVDNMHYRADIIHYLNII